MKIQKTNHNIRYYKFNFDASFTNNLGALAVAMDAFRNFIGIWCKILQVFDTEVVESRVISLISH